MKTAIVHVRLRDASKCGLFQGILEGEDHLGVLRGSHHGIQEVWCSSDRIEEIEAWVAGLPICIGASIVRVELCEDD